MQHDDESGLCALGDHEHGMFVRAEYEMVDTEDGNCMPVGASIGVHLHGVPSSAGAATLTLMAARMLADHMAHDVFGDLGNDRLAHAMAFAAAKRYLIDLIESMPENVDEFSMEVPNDISELLKGD